MHIAGIGYGVLGVGVAFIASTLDGVLQVTYTVIGTMSGPLLGLFILSVAFPFVTVPVRLHSLIGISVGRIFYEIS